MSDDTETLLNKRIAEILSCTCEDRYSIEPHGDGYAIYFGRCDHRHGANLALLTEVSGNRSDLIKYFEKALNKELLRKRL